jgi:hypothetical protein
MNQAILNTLGKFPPGTVFQAQDFLSFAPRNTIDQILGRLFKRGDIRKACTGLYYIPVRHPLFGFIPPDSDQIARSYAKKFGYQIQVNPAKSANLLGLSNQVPAQIVYLTDGPTKSISAIGVPIHFHHVCAKKLKGSGTKSALIVQALYYFGQNKITGSLIQKIQLLLSDQDQADLQALLPFCPSWMQKVISRILDHA